MSRLCAVLCCATILGCTANAPAPVESGNLPQGPPQPETDSAGNIRVRFVPNSDSAASVQGGNSASWSPFRAVKGSDDGRVQVWAWTPVGGTFWVNWPDEPPVFKVRLNEGDDDHLSLEVLVGEDEPIAVELDRDDQTKVEVAKVEYEFYYPSTWVAATSDKTTTNKAMVIVTTQQR